jgi:hypothetical protein
VDRTTKLGQPDLSLLPLFTRFSNYSNQIKLAKYEKGTSRTPKISKHCMVTDYFLMDNIHFWSNF